MPRDRLRPAVNCTRSGRKPGKNSTRRPVAVANLPDMVEKHDREEMKREAERAVNEAGGGEAEGFEQSEEALREAAENFDAGHVPARDATPVEKENPDATYGEADHEYSSETPDDDHD